MDYAGCCRSPIPEEQDEAMSSHEANTPRHTSNESIILPCDTTSHDTAPRTQEEWEYNKTAGCADMAGELFEVKMLALIFLQALKTTDKFSIANNMSSAGLFDDIIFVDKVKETAYLIQLHHKGSRKTFGIPMFTSATSKFGLIKYLHAYRKIKVNYAEGNTELLHCGLIENMKFVFFTNYRIHNSVYSNSKEVTRVDDLFKTGGKTFSLKIDGIISQELKAMDQELSEMKQLLEELECDIKDIKDVSEIITERIKDKMASTNQAISERMTQLFKNPCKKELNSFLRWEEFQDVRDDETRNEFIGKLLVCSDQPNEDELDEKIKHEIRCLWLTSDSEVDGVCEGVIEGVQTWWKQRGNVNVLTATSRIWTKALHRRTREYLQLYGVSFVNTCTELLWKCIQSSPSLIVAVLIKGDIPTLTFIKLLQPSDLSAIALNRSIFIRLDVLSKEKVKVLSALKTVWCEVLVVECGCDLDPVVAYKLGEELVQVAELHQKKVVLITRRDHALINAMKRQTLSYDEYEDDSRWENLQPDSQKVLRSRVVSFQGEHILLDDVIRNQEELMSKIDVVTLGLLLKPDKLQLGKRLADSISLYVPRRLGESTEPVKALSDVSEKVVLVTGPPGMGKSTLLTELAKVTKSEDPSLWVVRLNLADCSQYLEELKSENITDGFEFLRKFSFDCCTPFEEALFTHCVRQGKIIILLDAADEVITYLDKVLTILEKLPKSKISALWLTSRSIVQTQIEGRLHIKATELVPFSEPDQLNFLMEFWKSRHTDIDTVNLKEFVEALLELAKNTLYDHSSTFTGVPQLIGMMAEIYEYDLKQYSEGSIKLPNTLDLARLYSGSVKKKHDAFFKDKKKLDPMQAAIPANKDEKEKHFRYFVRNHMKAAVRMYFGRDDYAQLGIGSEIERDLEQFYEEIKSGVEKTGIIDGMTPLGQPRFIHRTFIEYFVALWISVNYINIRNFSRNRMFESNLKLINELLNGILAQDCPLHESTLKRDFIEVDRLLESQAEIVDKTDGGLRTALHLVALTYEHSHRLASVTIAQSLLRHSALVILTDDVFDMRPLEIADRTQAWPIAGAILRHGGDAKDMETTRNQTGEDFEELVEFLRHPHENVARLVEIATKHGVVSLLHYLVDEYSGDVNATATLMHIAAEGGHVNVMTYLNAKGISYTITDEDSNVPLHYASKGGRMAAVEFLLDHGCAVDVRNNRLETPLIIAAGSAAAALDVVVFLVGKGADINASNHEDLSSLNYSVTSEKFGIVKYLLELGANAAMFDVEDLKRRIDEAERNESRPRDESKGPHFVSMSTSLAIDIGNDVYNMNHKRRGHAVIFKHEHFEEEHYSTRMGSSVDSMVASDTFQKLGFAVSVHDDLRLADIKKVIKQLRAEDHSDADCLVIVVLSHGKEDGYVMAYDMMYSTDYLWQSFKPDNCPSMAGKPKLFFIQGCRGNAIDLGDEMYESSSSQKYVSTTETDGRPYNSAKNTLQQRIPAAADVLIAHSTVNGYVSFRNTELGGWFIQSLCRELLEGCETLDLMKILTRTTRRVALYYEANWSPSGWGGGRQVPSTLSMLTRAVYLRPKDQAESKTTTE